MSLFSRWSRQKESLEKREEQRQQSKSKLEEENPAVSAPAKVGLPASAERSLGGPAEPEVVGKSKKSNLAHRLLLKPLVTEKSSYLQGGGVYCFAVHPEANKTEIKKAVEAVFSVKVIKIRVINYQGKKVRYGRVRGVRKHWKKAIITLKSGQKIEIHKNV